MSVGGFSRLFAFAGMVCSKQHKHITSQIKHHKEGQDGEETATQGRLPLPSSSSPASSAELGMSHEA